MVVQRLCQSLKNFQSIMLVWLSVRYLKNWHLLMVSKRNPDACCSDMLMTFQDDVIIAPLVPFCQPLRLKQHPGACVHKQRIYSNSNYFFFFLRILVFHFSFSSFRFFPRKIWCLQGEHPPVCL